MKGHDAGAATDIGKVREHNEDRSLVERRRDTLIVAVADGVGGAQGGDVASEAAIAELVKAYFERGGKNPNKDLVEAMKAANTAVLGTAQEKGLKGAATTLVAAAIKGRRAAIGNLGDSRAYVLRKGVLRQITRDHTGSVNRSITRFAGDPRGANPDVFTERLAPGDRLLLCSDGVTIHLEPNDIVPLLANGDAEDSARSLVSEAVQRGGRDNATAVVVVAAPRQLRWDLLVLWTTFLLALAAIGSTMFYVSQQPLR
jgi:protein phosphatase